MLYAQLGAQDVALEHESEVLAALPGDDGGDRRIAHAACAAAIEIVCPPSNETCRERCR